MSEYRRAPYVGVSGIVNPGQQAELRQFADKAFEAIDAVLMMGVKAVHKTQWLDIDNRYGRGWYPVGESEFASALDLLSTTDNTAQMYLEPEVLAADPEYGTEFVRQVKRRGRAWLHSIQFDMLPYHLQPEHLGYLVHEAKRDVGLREYSVIVQCHADSMAEGPQRAIEKLKRLSPDEIDWILFDASHGKGKDMNPDELKRFLEVAFDDADLRSVGFGIAGGLDAASVQTHLPAILRDFPELSWDAEGKLHKAADGSLDMAAAKEYLAASADVIKAA